MNSNRSFTLGVLSLGLFVFTMISFVINKTSDGHVSTFSIGFPLLITSIFLILAGIYSMKSLKEGPSLKKYLGITSFLLCLAGMIIVFATNAWNILSLFNSL